MFPLRSDWCLANIVRGGKTVLLDISKRGDQELRGLLVHGARAVIRMAHKKQDRLSRRACRLVERRGVNKATVALANKLARIAWAVTTQNKPYTPDKVVA